MYTEMQIFIRMSHSKKFLNVGNYAAISPVAQVLSPAGMYQPFPPQSPPPAAQPVHPATHQKAEWYAAGEETFEKRLQQELNLADIQVELCQGNYKRKFHHLICWEEKAHIDILAEK